MKERERGIKRKRKKEERGGTDRSSRLRGEVKNSKEGKRERQTKSGGEE